MIKERVVVGVDEVGRGSLAGPVVAAAVVLPGIDYPWLSEIKDSKKLSASKREKLSELIREHCHWTIAQLEPYQIDEMNILQATLRAMELATNKLCSSLVREDRQLVVLVDGNQLIPGLNSDIEQHAVVGGDNLHRAIAAASIVAKVCRDTYMSQVDVILPEYGFAKHKGYGTEEHRMAIMVHGPSLFHRRTFRGVAEYVKD